MLRVSNDMARIEQHRLDKIHQAHGFLDNDRMLIVRMVQVDFVAILFLHNGVPPIEWRLYNIKLKILVRLYHFSVF